MEVLHIHENYLPFKGGSAIRISNILEAQLLRFNDKIDVLCSSDSRFFLRKERLNGVNLIRIPYFRFLVFFISIKLLIFNKYDVIHIHNSWLGILLFPLFFSNKKIVLELHSYKNQRGFKELLHNFIINNADSIIVLSRSTKELLISKKLKSAEQIHIVINGVDRKTFYPNRKKESLTKRLIYSGSLYDWQGIKSIVDLAKLNKNSSVLRFLIVGNGPLSDWVKEQIAQNELQNLKIMSFVEKNELIKLLSSSRAALILRPNLQQTNITFPLKILEYASLKIPIICTNRDAHFEILNKDQNRSDYFNIVSDDLNILNKEILSIIDNIDLLENKAANLFNHISENNYSWLSSAENTRKAYV